MNNLIIKIYEWMRKHPAVRRTVLATTTIILIAAALSLHFKEDISDFLPLDNNRKLGMEIYQDIAGSNKIITTVSLQGHTGRPTPQNLSEDQLDSIISAVDLYAELVGNTIDSIPLLFQIDIDKAESAIDFIYNNAPYLLTDSDWRQIDSITSDTAIIATRLQSAFERLLFPTTTLFSQTIAGDPLGIFFPLLSKIQRNGDLTIENYNSYIFTPDMSRAILIMDSPFGSSETSLNGELVDTLQEQAAYVMGELPNIDIRLIGAPVIAVENARQIKKDTILTITISLLLILIVLFVAFRNIRHLLLMALSVAWGFVFALAGLSIIHNSVSVIAIGISSIIIGIAVNYPLHLIAHLSHTTNQHSTLKEIISPLIIGNITTVGAFLALTPLKSTALRDLGIFSAFLLIGTIIFVLVFLPHITKRPQNAQRNIFDHIGQFRLEEKKWLVWTIVILTPIFGYFSTQTKFDSNLSNINYMTDQQREDMEYFASTVNGEKGMLTIYVASIARSFDTALMQNEQLQTKLSALQDSGYISSFESCSPMICSASEQQERLSRWNSFCSQHASTLKETIQQHGARLGFDNDAFTPFFHILDRQYGSQPLEHFRPLTSEIFAQHFSSDSASQSYRIVNIIQARPDMAGSIEAQLSSDNIFAFDIPSLNSAITTNLSDDFNYIGWACSAIVFIFLWLSFGSIELAVIAFLPMAVSWIWILGIMGMLGIKFNIVNIILATFIFGQGDDYTIFMTEGAVYEHKNNRPILSSYRSSIIISALVMFIGIGTLILARHPAMRSLAEVTIIGMTSVVLMAYVFPPLIYKWLIHDGRNYRKEPLSFKLLLKTILKTK